jgi:hypothetical protein
MRQPPTVHVTLQPSRRAAAAIILLALATAAILLWLPLEPEVSALALVCLLAWAIDRVHVVALRRSPRSTRELWLTGERLLVVRDGSGRLAAGHVRSASYVGARITTIVWRPDGMPFSRAECILPDMLPAEDFRRLRVLLRYGRSDDTQDAPASHA